MSTPQFHLRRAIASDLDAILTLERATHLAPHWPPSAYSEILAAPMGSSIEGNDPGAPSIPSGAPFIPRSLRNGWETETQRCLLVAEMNEQIAGFAVGLLHPDASDRIAELESVAVSASYRRAGIGRALCRAVLDWSRSQGATEVVLEVRASSSVAVALYASLGFTLAARRPRYYRGPNDDALLMRLQLERSGREQLSY
jgi:ribosomal-protein-alanine N-acetyltransferase